MTGTLLIIGVGFMGGSLALALRHSGYGGKILGVDINSQALEEATARGIIDIGFESFDEVDWNEVNSVILATPVRTFRNIAGSIKNYLKGSAIVTDLGSVKGRLVLDLENTLGPRFVGSHPIAGTEKSGVSNSKADLFRAKKIITTPTQNTDPDALESVESLWRSVGGVIERMDPFLHDRVFGAVSHLPHAVAFALIDAIIELSREVDLFMYPGGGFKDFTRIAKSDPVMWRDIFLENRQNTIEAIETFIESLDKLKILIKEEKEEALTGFLREAKERRMSME